MSNPRFRRASYCNSSAECVEVAQDAMSRVVLIRDSGASGRPMIRISYEQWRDLLDQVKSGPHL
ncbi:DUF397 domain-containing protein [Actinomadura sp. WMMA1423]|uniref:DUF397 domain-containing protein n=1 Tax=Actinomadura sp. WMMA1423 TaxID=2591108 RepID=UPI001146515E